MQVGNAPLLQRPVSRADGSVRPAAAQQAPAVVALPGASSPAVPVAAAANASVGRQDRAQQLAISELQTRERAVRAAEVAQAALAGKYAGSPVYSYARGPDGQAYAVSGDVPLDVSPIPNDPQATLRKMQVVLQAAMASGEASPQDVRVAAQARAVAAQARAELAAAERQKEVPADDERPNSEKKPEAEDKPAEPRQKPAIASSLDLYRVLDAIQATRSVFSERA
jgi:SprA-related family